MKRLVALTTFLGCMAFACSAEQVVTPGELDKKISTREIARTLPSAEEKGQLLWSGKSGNFYLRWTTRDLTLSKDGGADRISFWRNTVASNFEELRKQSQSKKCDYTRSLDVLSIVGNLLSIRDSLLLICGTPSRFGDYVTFDLTKTPVLPTLHSAEKIDRIRLNDLFSEEEIIVALQSSRIGRRLSRELKRNGSQGLDRVMQTAVDLLQESESAMTSSELADFSFIEFDEKRAIVRLHLTPTLPTDRRTPTPIDLELKIGLKLRSFLGPSVNPKEALTHRSMPSKARRERSVFHRTTEK